MAGSVNKVTLIGNLGNDPEIRSGQNGSKIVSFTMATSESWVDKASGERRENVEWHRIVVFNEHVAGIAERFLTKGRKVYVEGTLKTRKWTDQAGQERFTTEVVIDRFKGDLVLIDGGNRASGDTGQGGTRSAGSTRAARGASAPAGGGATGWEPQGSDLDDEVPF